VSRCSTTWRANSVEVEVIACDVHRRSPLSCSPLARSRRKTWSVAFAAQAGPSVPEMPVDNIRVEGLQRVSEGTVYNYLPVNIGDRFDAAARARGDPSLLYDTGFCR
jgi:hypothetical protein